MSQDNTTTTAKMTISSYQKRGRKRPIIHVLMPDGRVTEFKDRGFIILDEETTEADDQVVALLMIKRACDGKLTPAATPDGKPALVSVPVMGVNLFPDPDKLISWKDVAKRLGVSLSGAKRMVAAGKLPQPMKIGKRKVAFKRGDVDAALAKLRD